MTIKPHFLKRTSPSRWAADTEELLGTVETPAPPRPVKRVFIPRRSKASIAAKAQIWQQLGLLTPGSHGSC